MIKNQVKGGWFEKFWLKCIRISIYTYFLQWGGAEPEDTIVFIRVFPKSNPYTIIHLECVYKSW